MVDESVGFKTTRIKKMLSFNKKKGMEKEDFSAIELSCFVELFIL